MKIPFIPQPQFGSGSKWSFGATVCGAWNGLAWTVGVLLLLPMGLRAQQEVMISQYLFNGLLLNPAYAGSHPYLSTSALHRNQWMGITGAPTSQILAADGPVAGDALGIGVLAQRDQIGISTQMDISINVCYRMRMPVGHWAWGLRVGGTNYRANLADAVIWDVGDPAYEAGLAQAFVPKVGVGTYYHNERFYLGLSVPVAYAWEEPLHAGAGRIFEPHGYFQAGAVFHSSRDLTLKPSFLVKYTQAAPAEVDFNLHAFIRNKFCIGAGYRTGAMWVAMAEFQVTPQLRLGYAHDFTTTPLQDLQSGTHEIMLGWDWGPSLIKSRSPRYF